MAFVKATRKQKKARIVVEGPPGAGKTKTSLLLMRGLLGPNAKFAVVDTEHGSSTAFVGEDGIGDFDVDSLSNFSVENYVASIQSAARAKYPGIVIDSGSHEWQGAGGLLEFVDTHNNKFGQGWKLATPKHHLFIETMLSYPGHVIMTLRTKMKYEVQQSGDKTTVKKLGMEPIQREGISYEFDVVGRMDDRTLMVDKSRATFLQDVVIFKPGIDLGEKLRAWLEAGEEWVAPEMPRAFAVGNMMVSTAGVTEVTYNAIVQAARKYETEHGTGSAGKLLKEKSGKATIRDLTEEAGLVMLAAYEGQTE